MRRYFFHISDERGWTKDHDGSQFGSDEAARGEAAKAGKLIVGQKMIKGMALQAALAGKIVVTASTSKFCSRSPFPTPRRPARQNSPEA